MMNISMPHYDVIIIGGGAAGLMCAAVAGQKGKNVLLLERAKKIGAKILISGGGRCNFTNLGADSNNYISHNPHFAKSALSRFTQWDIMDLFARNGLSWGEKKLGQLFCDQGSAAVVKLLLDECVVFGVDLRLSQEVEEVCKSQKGFELKVNDTVISTSAIVIATGGLSIPKMGATDFAYRLAKQFGLNVIDTRPALVPFTFQNDDLAFMKNLTGVSVPVIASAGDASFHENLLFTHRGLSGPAMLQISSYWREGEKIALDLLPGVDAKKWLEEQRKIRPRALLSTIVKGRMPDRFADAIFKHHLDDVSMASLSNEHLQKTASFLNGWELKPQGTEGYRTAEVTLGGVDCNDLSSKTMETRDIPGLYFVGECVDVTGWLGGYNFQWAWASGWAAGQAL